MQAVVLHNLLQDISFDTHLPFVMYNDKEVLLSQRKIS